MSRSIAVHHGNTSPLRLQRPAQYYRVNIVVHFAHMAAILLAVLCAVQSFPLSGAFAYPSQHHSLPATRIRNGRSVSRQWTGTVINNHQANAVGGENYRLGANSNQYRCRNSWSLNLVPFSEAWNANANNQQQPFSGLLPELGCPSLNSEGMLIRNSPDGENERYRLYLATDVDDLPPIAELTIDVFDATAIALSGASDWSAFERAMVGALVEPAVGMYNSYARAVAFTEVLSGLRTRMRNRISDGGGGDRDGGRDRLAPLVAPAASPPSAGASDGGGTPGAGDVAARSSLILALARPVGAGSSSSGDGGAMEAVASVELRLQPTDAKIPFSQPWLDQFERKLASSVPFARGEPSSVATTKGSPASSDGTIEAADATSSNSGAPPLRPYLCNLCVAPSLRSLGVGRALCRIVEAVARQRWGYSHLYLHVDPANDAARGLYEKEGYVDVGRRWNMIWSGGASGISYYVKRLGEEERVR